MAKTYFVEYTQYINNLQNRLMRIQFRFNNILENIRRDMAAGLLSSEEGNRLLNVRMDQYVLNVDEKYSLSKSDAEFVKVYAELDDNGQLLSTILKREYLDKAQYLRDIFEAVRIFGYLDSIGDKNARITVKDALSDYYSERLRDIENKLERLAVYGESEKHTVRYKNLSNERDSLLKALKAFEQLESAPTDVFERIVSQFYKVKKSYYDWFLQMQIKQEYEDAAVYGEHCSLMEKSSDTSDTILTASDSLVKLNKELEDTNSNLFSLLTGLSSFDFSTLVNDQTKSKKRFFKKEEDNNKELLFNIFLSLLNIKGLKEYVEVVYGNGDSCVNLNSAFNIYFKSKYGEETLFVEPNKFINDIRDEIVLYFKDKLAEITHKINEINVKINSNTTLLCGNIRLGVSQANLLRDIREQYPAKRDQLMIRGFTFEELDRIYTDLKEYIGNGFSLGTDEEEIFLRKV